MKSPLEPDRQERDALTDGVLGYLAQWFDAIPDMDASGIDLTHQQLEDLRRPPDEEGRPLEAILADLTTAGQAGIYHAAGGHMSYIPNAGMYSAALAEFLAAGLNRYTGVAGAAPGFSAIEHGVIGWMTSLFGMGPDASGLLLSGGSMANLTGIVTARTAKLGDDFGNGVMYVTPHTHHSSAKAARLAGLREDQIVPIVVDSDLHMNVKALESQIAADRKDGKRPFLVIPSAGTTDTGSVDPLGQIASVAEVSDVWLHVDAAYGGFFQLTERGRETLHGINRADSIALDPHKGLSVPFGAGALVVRDEGTLVDAHEGRGAYLRDEDSHQGLRDISSLGPELSRPARGLQVWLPLQLHGVAPFRDALDRSLDQATYAHKRLSGVNGIDACWNPDLSVVAFRFDDDALGWASLEAINEDRTVHLSPTVIDERFVLRFAILNRRTTTDHIDHAIDIIEKTLAG